MHIVPFNKLQIPCKTECHCYKRHWKFIRMGVQRHKKTKMNVQLDVKCHGCQVQKHLESSGNWMSVSSSSKKVTPVISM